MNALILLVFLALFLFAGKKLFNVRDWGKHLAGTGQEQGKAIRTRRNPAG